MSSDDRVQWVKTGTTAGTASARTTVGKLVRSQGRGLRLGMGRVFYGLLAVSLWLLFELMPERFALRFASPLGKFLRRGTREQIIDSMRRILGRDYCRDGEWKRLWISHTQHAALMAIELIHLHRLPIANVHQRITIEGEEHVRDALRSNRGVMLFINHMGNMACVVGGLAIHGYDVTLAGNRIWIPFLERQLAAIHRRVGAKRVHLGKGLAWTAASAFRRNGIFATFIDFSVSSKHDVWLEIGEAEMSMSLGPAIMALRNEVDVICASCIRLPANRHRVIIHPPLRTPRSGVLRTDATALMRDALRLLEADLLRRPEQWWTWDKAHLRLRDRPQPCESLPQMAGEHALT